MLRVQSSGLPTMASATTATSTASASAATSSASASSAASAATSAASAATSAAVSAAATVVPDVVLAIRRRLIAVAAVEDDDCRDGYRRCHQAQHKQNPRHV
ncbi:unnamed protein product [Musa banksii]